MQSVSQQQSVPQDSPDREMTAATLVMLLWACSECGADPIDIKTLSVYQPGAEDDIPELKFCRPEAPCQYGEGDCTRHGDDGCDSDLVCGVNNCGDFVAGMAGSCCAQLAGPSEFLEEESPRQWTSWAATWGGWGRQRSRVLTARDGTLSYQWEDQEFN